MPKPKLNLMLNAEAVLGLVQRLRGEPGHESRPAAFKRDLDELAIEAAAVAGTELVPLAHDHRHGTSVFLVRKMAEMPDSKLGPALQEYDGQRFELEEGGDEWVAVGDLEVVDLRAEKAR